MALSLRNLDRRDDLPAIRTEAQAVGERLDMGEA
jgi:hypothetical protein